MSTPAGSEGVSGAPGVVRVHSVSIDADGLGSIERAPVPHPPAHPAVSARARVLASTSGLSEVQAQRALDRGWLK